MGPYQVSSLRFTVGRGLMTMKWYAKLKAPDLDPHQMLLKIGPRITLFFFSGGSYSSVEDAIGFFFARSSVFPLKKY